MSIEEGFIETGGPKLYYRQLGQGPRTLVVPNGAYLLDDLGELAGRYKLMVYDPRNRGRSETVTDSALLAAGIRNDVDDLERVRVHFGLHKLELIAHSYAGLLTGLYAATHPDRIARLVQIGPVQPFAGKKYPVDLTYDDGVLASVFARLAQVRERSAGLDDVERCRQSWQVLREIYVTDVRSAARADWGRCDEPNERNFMAYWMQYLLPSMQSVTLTPAQLAAIHAPVLVVHGRKDRSAPYGGGRDWALNLGNARLLTIAEGGHAPWIEAPDEVMPALVEFLDGRWPERSQNVTVSVNASVLDARGAVD